MEEIQHILENQDYAIMELKGLVVDIKEDEQFFHPTREMLRAMRSLCNLFQSDGLIYDDKVEFSQLKAWCIAHDFNFDQILESFGEVKEKKNPIYMYFED